MSEKIGVCISLDRNVKDSADALSRKLDLTRSKVMELAISAGLPSVERMMSSLIVFPKPKPQPQPVVSQETPAAAAA